MSDLDQYTMQDLRALRQSLREIERQEITYKALGDRLRQHRRGLYASGLYNAAIAPLRGHEDNEDVGHLEAVRQRIMKILDDGISQIVKMSPPDALSGVVEPIPPMHVVEFGGHTSDTPMARSPESARSMAVSLAVLVFAEIERLEADRPNDRSYIDFLRMVAEGLTEIAEMIDAAQSEPDVAKKPSQFKRASELASNLALRMKTWIDQHRDEIQYGRNLGLLGAGTAFLTFCGAPQLESFLASLLLLGGRTVRESIDTILKCSAS